MDSKMNITMPSGGRLEFIWCPPGEFYMGSDITDKYYQIEAIPKVKVSLTKGFWISATPILNKHVNQNKGNSDAPVHDLSWTKARKYCEYLFKQVEGNLPSTFTEKKGAFRFDLPTEAQWEYATRAMTKTPWFFGDKPDLLEEYAVCCKTTKSQKIYEVSAKQKKPNPWGLYDTYGLIPEYCRDEYLPYRFWSNFTNPWITPESPEYLEYVRQKGKFIMPKVIRGGHRFGGFDMCNSYYRGVTFDEPIGDVGFRLVIIET